MHCFSKHNKAVKNPPPHCLLFGLSWKGSLSASAGDHESYSRACLLEPPGPCSASELGGGWGGRHRPQCNTGWKCPLLEKTDVPCGNAVSSPPSLPARLALPSLATRPRALSFWLVADSAPCLWSRLPQQSTPRPQAVTGAATSRDPATLSSGLPLSLCFLQLQIPLVWGGIPGPGIGQEPLRRPSRAGRAEVHRAHGLPETPTVLSAGINGMLLEVCSSAPGLGTEGPEARRLPCPPCKSSHREAHWGAELLRTEPREARPWGLALL